MKRRVEINAWGLGTLETPAWAMHDDDSFESKAASVANAIARKNGLHVVNLLSAGSAVEHNKIIAHHFEVTFGRPAYGGGWNIEGRCWIATEV